MSLSPISKFYYFPSQENPKEEWQIAYYKDSNRFQAGKQLASMPNSKQPWDLITSSNILVNKNISNIFHDVKTLFGEHEKNITLSELNEKYPEIATEILNGGNSKKFIAIQNSSLLIIRANPNTPSTERLSEEEVSNTINKLAEVIDKMDKVVTNIEKLVKSKFFR